MIIIGCDFHPRWQVIAFVDTETGETGERKLVHATGEARRFYEELKGAVRVGLEATGNSHWFTDMLSELGHEVWVGDAARIRAAQVRKQKTDRRDAAHILELLLKNDFPRIWTPSPQERDQRQLLIHRHKLVRMRGQVKTELQHLAMNQTRRLCCYSRDKTLSIDKYLSQLTSSDLKGPGRLFSCPRR